MPNKLIYETSPYLLQHANNPVNWQPYGTAAIEEAKERNLPIIISIGYSACHWCHVMEHESFSRPDVAEIMNDHFICIKVDREERPDVDQFYLNSIQILHGQSGWPLNCFALPDGRPFWGGTYFRPDQWKEVLLQLSDLFHNNHEDLVSQAERIIKGIKGMGIIDAPTSNIPLNINTVEDAFEQLSIKFDRTYGGMKGAPKFPMPAIWQFVLNYYHISHSVEAITHLRQTLEKMASGGIFDQLAGGFSRYSTDQEWKVPHFEKMLYDNAQLAVLYANVYRATGIEFYSNILNKILHFVKNELTSPEGAFYAAIDADSDGAEGQFYVWKKQEILDLLPDYGELLCRYWGVDKQAHWEKGQNILQRTSSDEQFALVEHLSTEELKQLVKMASTTLLNYRNKRIRPSLDNKIIVSWNAMMIKAYVTAAFINDNPEYRETALKAANFIKDNMISSEGMILRTWQKGVAKINGFLDDYALTADAFISLYQLTFDELWLFKAKQIIDYVIREFSQDSTPMFWYMPRKNGENSIADISRILETTDGVEPSGNSVMAGLLLAIGNYFEDSSYIARSEMMCTYMHNNIISYPGYYANWATVTAAHTTGVGMVVITGPKAIEYARQLQSQFSPFSFFAAASNKSDVPVFMNKFKGNKTVIYKCIKNKCEAPIEKVEDFSF